MREPGKSGRHDDVREFRTTAAILGGLLLGGLLLGGCVPAETPAALDAAAGFQSRVTAEDWPAACDALSDEARASLEATAARPCAQALPRLRLASDPVGEAEVWGDNAKVAIGPSALFLSRFTAGWRVTGAGCQPRGEELPYRCAVRG
jgi:hypothetical protein